MDAQKKVMFVDDEEGVRRSWNRYLSLAGFDVRTAEDGAKAIERLREEPVDVVVSDLKMPGLDGVKLLEWINQELPETKFILLTGYGDEEVERKVRELGAFEYLNKPISPEQLSGVVTAASILSRQAPAVALEAPVVEAVEAVAVEEAPTLEAVTAAEAPAVKSRLRASAEVLGGLIVAPILGLAFVVFLPIVGFGALIWTMGEKGWDLVKPAPVHEDS